MENLGQIARFAFQQANAKAQGEPFDIFDWQSVATNLNNLFAKWRVKRSVNPGFSRKAFRITEKKAVYSIGNRADDDFKVGGRISDIKALEYRAEGGGKVPFERRNANMVVPTSNETSYPFLYYGAGDCYYGLTYDRLTARLIFPFYLQPGIVIVIDYNTGFGKIPYLPDDATDAEIESLQNIVFGLSETHISAIAYGLAERIAAENNSSRVSDLRSQYRGYMNDIMDHGGQRITKRYDESMLPYYGRTDRSWAFSQGGGVEDIGGDYQDDGPVIIEEDHPDHPEAVGTAHWGAIFNNEDTQEGAHGFMLNQAFDIVFNDPQPGQTLYIDLPAGFRLLHLRSGQLDSVNAWQEGQHAGQVRYTIGPLDQYATRRVYSAIVSRVSP